MASRFITMLFTVPKAFTSSSIAPAIPSQSNSAHIANIQQLLSLFLLLLPLPLPASATPTLCCSHANCLRSRAEQQVHKKLSVSVGHMLVCITDEPETSLRLDALCQSRNQWRRRRRGASLPAPTALSILRATNYGLLIKSHNKQKCVQSKKKEVTNESKKEKKTEKEKSKFCVIKSFSWSTSMKEASLEEMRSEWNGKWNDTTYMSVQVCGCECVCIGGYCTIRWGHKKSALV